MLIYFELVKKRSPHMSYCNEYCNESESKPQRRSPDYFPFVEFERRLQKEAIKEFIFSEENKNSRHYYSDKKGNMKFVN